MLKNIAFVGLTLAVLASCDVRTKDKIADTSKVTGTGSNINTDNAPATTVQVIDTTFDFGKVSDGEIVEFSYRFKNTGTNPLIISNAAASCGCTVPEKPEAPIKPGETGYIKVKFNSEGRVGQAHKTVTVTSNASPAFPQLLLKGEVVAKDK